MKDFLIKLLAKLNNPDQASLDMSLADCHVKGLFSLVVSGTEHGKLTRIFISTKDIKPLDIQYHSHRYNLFLYPLHGNIVHHVAGKYDYSNTHKPLNLVTFDVFKYQSPLNGGNGLTYETFDSYLLSKYHFPIGGRIHLFNSELHTVSCSAGSIWVVNEGGFKSDHSLVLGVPFTLDNLYRNATQHEIDEMLLKVKDVVNNLLSNYRV